MDRNREGRRSGVVSSAAAGGTSNGLSSSRRRHRTNSLRDSPDEDGGVEIQESVRLRERVVKKDRDRDRGEHNRERDNRTIGRINNNNKRRRASGGDNRLMMMHGGGGGGDDTSEESVNDDEDEDEDDTNNNNSNNVVSATTRLLPPAVPVGSISSNHHQHQNHNINNNHLQPPPRKSFPPNSGGKVFRTATAPVWKPGDEMIGVSVPRKARSASTKRSHDWIGGGGGGGVNNSGVVTGEQIQVSTSSPVRQNTTSTPSPAAPLSPSSSNVSVRKKIKPNNNGPKRPPPPAKSPPKASSSNPEELEIEIAEVLYGLMTSSSKKEPNDATTTTNREVVNNNRSRVSSPVSNSNSSATPLSAVAPKRKRPRQVVENPGGFGNIRSSPIPAKVELMDQTTTKMEVSSPNLEKAPSSAAENGVSLYDLSANLPPASDPAPEPVKVESDAKGRAEESEFSKEELSSPKRESAENSNREDAAVAVAQVSSIVSEVESQREEKFQIDLMAPPPQLRLSPEREAEMDFGSAAVDSKPIMAEKMVEMKAVVNEKDDERTGKAENQERVSVEVEEKKTKAALEELNSHKTSESSSRGRNVDLKFDLEKPEKESGVSSKFQQQSQKLQQYQQLPPQKATKEESVTDKSGQSSSLPMPMSMASWPGGLPPMGYMAPLQGVVAMDGTTVSSAPIQQPLFSQPRPKRCATHCYIARNIHYLQQFMKMHPFWPPAAASSASFFGPKANLNVMPPTDLLAGRGASAGPEKGQGLAIFPGSSNGSKDKVQPVNIADAAQRKQQQILLQQALPPVAPNNLLHGPALFFPINQQQAAAAAAVRPGPTKSPSTTGMAVSSNTSNPAAGTASATTGGAATAISFNYPNMSPNEAQYLAILQNNAYAFPIPAVGGPPNYRGTHPQPMPLFNGSFYSSQMIHPSQVQQQQQPSTSQSQQMQPGQQNTSVSSGSSPSQKHLQSQQQRSQGNAVNGGSGGGNLHNFHGAKNHHPSQSPAVSQNHHVPPQTRHNESEVGSEDSPSTTERKRSHGPMNVYNQNFAMPMPPSNFGLMTPPGSFGIASSASGGSNQPEKKAQPQQQQGLQKSLESVPSQPFAMSFTSLNGATGAPGIDMSMAQNHAIFQSLPEATRQNLQMAAAAAAQAVQQKKNVRISDDAKSGPGDQLGADAERKGLAMKPSGNTGQSIAFSRSDMSDASGSTIAANSVIDSSSRSLNLPSSASWNPRAGMQNALGAVNVPNVQLQAQIQQQQQQQQQQMIQLHKQQQQQQQQQQMAAAVTARSKTPASSNGNVYSDHVTSAASAASKFPNAMSAFPQNLVQTGNSSSQAQSPQWKSSTRTSASQTTPSLSSTSSLKNLSQQQQQQQVRSQQSHAQISFGTNQKSAAAQQGQQPPNNNQSPSSPMMVGSPTTSSISKGAGGSPRTTNSASTSNKTGQNSSLSTQQGKSTSSVPNQKSSPAGGRNVPSILGNPHIASNSSGGTKSLMQQQQQHMQKGMQQAHLFFSSQYMQAQPPHSTGASSPGQPAGGYYLQRRRSDQPGQHQAGSSAAASSSSGMLTLCPVTLSCGTTSDPAKAIAAAAAAASNMKGGVLPSQGILHASQYTTSSGGQHQLLPAGFSYVHPVPAAVQVKPAEQKQPAGNDNLHACWQPEKK